MSDIRKYSTNSMQSVDRAAGSAMNIAMNTGMAWLDMMLNIQREMQRLSLASFSSYSPTADTRISGRLRAEEGTRVVPVGEERLNVATHTMPGEVTRIRRRVVSQPVEQDVTLREEKVVVERRPATNTAPTQDILHETVVEMSDSTQVPTVWKSVHVAEEVVLRKHVTERIERVREVVRRDVVDVEHARASLPVSVHEVAVHVEHEHLPALRPENADKARASSGPDNAAEKRTQDEAKKLAAPQQANATR